MRIFRMNYGKKWILYSLVAVLVLLFIGSLPFLFKLEEPVRKVINNLRNNGFSEDGLYTTQISSTFIVVSPVTHMLTQSVKGSHSDRMSNI